MRLLAVLLLFTSCSSKYPSIFLEGVYFPHTSGKISSIKVKGDSLYNYQVNYNGYKKLLAVSYISSYIQEPESDIVEFVLKNHRSDSKIDRREYNSIYCWKILDENKVLLIGEKKFNKQSELKDIRSEFDLNAVHGLTFYSKSNLESFSNLKLITTVLDYEKIVSFVESDTAKEIAKSLNNQNLISMYNLTLNAELFNQACLRNGYDPIGSKENFDKLRTESFKSN